MALALFDLDNTLLAGDSDHAWGEFLVSSGWVSASDHIRANDYFYARYQEGSLDIHEYVRFVTDAINCIPAVRRNAVREQFLSGVIHKLIAPGTPELLRQHREHGDTLVVITATLDFITRPIGEMLGVDDVIATVGERVADIPYPAFTGRISGTPAFQKGKVQRLSEWLDGHPEHQTSERWFYSDSHNDLPLLETVDHPVVVDPDTRLNTIAERRRWPVITLRH